MKKSFQKLLLSLSAAIFVVSAFAQVTTSSMSGVVVEDNGETLAGAAVLAVHVPSGTKYAALANSEGRYSINGMRSGGPYTVEYSFLGMNTVKYEDIVLKLGEPYELNVTMKSNTELEAVTIIGDKPFNASVTGAGSSFSRGTVESTPMINRSVYDVVKFTPQANINKEGGISFAGANNRYNSFQIDGAMSNDTFGLASSGTNGGQTGANPVSLDAIEEIQVVIAPFDVRQSGFTGGAINAVTKSGTNQVKGSVYGYYNNQDFIGTTPGDVEKREKYETQSSKTIGFTVGAPIIKDKLFIFVSGEYFNKSYPSVYNPVAGAYEQSKGTSRDNQKFKNSVTVDGTSYDYLTPEVAQAVINHYKQYYGKDVKGFSESFDEHLKEDKSLNALARIDWNINDANKLMVRYQLSNSTSDKYGSGYTNYYFNNSSYEMYDLTNTVVAELNSRISPSLQNMFRASAVMVRDHREVPYKGPNMYIQDNITVNIGTEYSSGANSMDSDTYTITDNLSWFLGNHEITFGTHNEIYRFNNLFLQAAYGEYVFSSLKDFFENKPNQFQYRYADPAVTGSDDPLWKAETYAAQFGLYAQDEWKPNRNLALTAGLRVDMPMLLNKPTENPDFNATEISKQYDQKVGTVPAATPLFSPRFGFRWFVNDSHTTLLRGGAGLFTGRVPFVWLSNAYNNTGMEAKSVTFNNPFNTWSIDDVSSNPYTDLVKPGHTAAGTGGTGSATINTLSKDFKYPQVFRVNLGLEQSFLDGWKFTFDGIFSKTLNNVFFRNLALTSNDRVYAVNENMGPSTKYYTIDKTYYAIVALENTNKGYTYSLSGQLQKHFDFGLDLSAAYTFGHSYSVNDGTSSVAYSNWKYNYSENTNGPEMSYSLFDKPHKLSAMVSYTSPVYAKILSTTIGLSYEGGSGQRYSYTMNETVDFNGDGQKGNSVLYIPTANEVASMNWSDPADAAKFENFIRSDKYLYNHRGEWSKRYAGIAPWENHFDLHISENFFYDKAHGRKVELMFDVLNIGNLFNREWGLYNSGAYNLQILEVKSVDKVADGKYVPTYHFNPKSINISDFYSRWRCQLGLRVTF